MKSSDYYRNDSDVIELDKNDFSEDNKVINEKFQNKFGLLKVYADWCGHCKNMTEMMNFLSTELKKEDFLIGAINYGTYEKDNKPNCLKNVINSFPTLLMINYDGTIEVLPNKLSNNMDNILDNICYFTNEKSEKYSKPKVCKKISNKLIDK